MRHSIFLMNHKRRQLVIAFQFATTKKEYKTKNAGVFDIFSRSYLVKEK